MGGKDMEDFLKKYFLSILLLLLLAGCGSSGPGNNNTDNGGGSVTFSASASQQKIVFAGGSSIARGNWSSYFGILIENDGVGGLESRGLVNAIKGYVASNPNKIFIMIGSNNILNRHESILVDDISTIIEIIRAVSPTTQIFIHSILPVNNTFSNGLIENYNNLIQSLCNAKNVKFISLYSLFKDSKTIIKLNYYQPDGIHLTDAGYQVWANVIREYVLS
jgi:lysophospholipase L1-like esterase